MLGNLRRYIIRSDKVFNSKHWFDTYLLNFFLPMNMFLFFLMFRLLVLLLIKSWEFVNIDWLIFYRLLRIIISNVSVVLLHPLLLLPVLLLLLPLLLIIFFLYLVLDPFLQGLFKFMNNFDISFIFSFLSCILSCSGIIDLFLFSKIILKFYENWF